MNRFTMPAAPARRQSGTVLEISMIIVLLLILIGLAAMRGTVMQDKMSSNFYDREIAFQAAQAALRYGESIVQNSTAGMTFRNCSAAACPPNPFDAGVTGTKVDADTFPGKNLADTPAASLLDDRQTEYIVEYMGTDGTGTGRVYRITARSGPTTGNNRATVTLQSIYIPVGI